MKIINTENPLGSIIELNEAEEKLLWHKIKILELEETIYDALSAVEDGNIDKAKGYLDIDNDTKFDAYVDKLFESFKSSLSDEHAGDCICVPCSCLKCHTEDLLGINTLPGINKQAAYYISSAFGGYKGTNTILQALENLKIPFEIIDGDDEYTINNKTKWNEAKNYAYNWLLTYKNKYF